MRTVKKHLYFWNLFLLSMLVFFTGCEQKEQTMEKSPAPIRETAATETPLPVEMMDDQLFYAKGMESISINEADLTVGKQVDMTVQVKEGREIYGMIGREDLNPQMKLNILPGEESEVYGIDLVCYLGEGFQEVMEDSYLIARSGFDYQMAWYDFNQDGEKELIFAGGDRHTTMVCSVFRLEVKKESSKDQSEYYVLEPKTILEIKEGVRAYVNDNNEICVVDMENNISKRTVPL